MDSCLSLKKFIDLAKPTKSFRELQVETDISLSQLYKFSTHLIYWNSAKVINTLTKTNVYLLNSGFWDHQPNAYRALNKDFSFPNFRFKEILEIFSKEQTLGEHISNLTSLTLQRDFVEVVIWMLQRNLLKQQHSYIYLLLQSDSKLPFPPPPSQEYPEAPIPLTQEERDYIEANLDKGPLYDDFLRYFLKINLDFLDRYRYFLKTKKGYVHIFEVVIILKKLCFEKIFQEKSYYKL